METIFKINGKAATKKQAMQHWLASDTYKNAKPSTRKMIWSIAIYGDSTGNHNPDGEITHLNEAGITLS